MRSFLRVYAVDFGSVTIGSGGSSYPFMHYLDEGNSLLYVVGNFTAVADATGSITRNRAACLDLTTARWTSWDPNFNNDCYGITPDAATGYCFITGKFTTVGGNSRVYVARVSLSTGTYDSGFNASVTSAAGKYVERSLVVSGSLYMVGLYSATNGSTRSISTRHDVSSGVLDTGYDVATNSPSTNSLQGIASFSNELYLMGSVTTWNGSTHNHCSRINKIDGTPDGWDPDFRPTSASTRVVQMADDGTDLYFTGSFTTVNGASPTRNRVAKISASTANVDGSWNPNCDAATWGICVDTSNSCAYIGHSGSTMGGTSNETVAKVDLTNGTLDTGFAIGGTNGASPASPYSISRYSSNLLIVTGLVVRASPSRYGIVVVNRLTGSLV